MDRIARGCILNRLPKGSRQVVVGVNNRNNGGVSGGDYLKGSCDDLNK
jgi:hypothetical protein